MTTYQGRQGFAGWVFTLTPETAPNGSPGYRRVTLCPRDGAFDAVRASCEANERVCPGYTERMRRAVESPDPDWVEEQWLTEWLASGLVRLKPAKGER